MGRQMDERQDHKEHDNEGEKRLAFGCVRPDAVLDANQRPQFRFLNSRIPLADDRRS
jgi:hypothetical protein